MYTTYVRVHTYKCVRVYVCVYVRAHARVDIISQSVSLSLKAKDYIAINSIGLNDD